MQDIGVWATATGTSEARLELESTNGDIYAQELPGWVSDALKGAVAGALTGAPGGPGGALVGVVTGGAIGAASGGGKPATAPTGAPGDASRTSLIQALQQFAAIVPALVQQLAASGKGKKEWSTGDAGESLESADPSDWGPESFQGTWTQP